MPTRRRYTLVTLRFMPLALGALCLLLAAPLYLFSSCSGGANALDHSRKMQAMETSAALAQLEALQAPEGVDAAVFASLKGALADALKARGGKAISSPPVGPKNTVNDFEIFYEEGQMRLRWHYRNNGDYDQNGVVGVADITPLAMHWNEGAFNDDTIQGVIDGNDNERVEVGDITPIAMNFGVNCTGYLLQSSATTNAADFSSIQSFAVSTGVGGERKVFMPLVDGTVGMYYRVCPYDGATVGPASNIVQFIGP